MEKSWNCVFEFLWEPCYLPCDNNFNQETLSWMAINFQFHAMSVEPSKHLHEKKSILNDVLALSFDLNMINGC